MVKDHLAPNGGKLLYAFRIGDGRRGVHDFKNPLGSGYIGDHLVVKVAQIHDRVPEHGNIGSERKEGSHGYPARAQHNNPHEIQGKQADGPAQVNDRPYGVVEPYRVDKGIPMLFCQIPEGVHGFGFRAEALDDPDAGKVLVHEGIQVGGFLPVDLPSFMGMGLDVPDSRGHQGKAHKGRCGKPGVLDEHDDGYRADGDEIRNQGGDAVGENIL